MLWALGTPVTFNTLLQMNKDGVDELWCPINTRETNNMFSAILLPQGSESQMLPYSLLTATVGGYRSSLDLFDNGQNCLRHLVIWTQTEIDPFIRWGSQGRKATIGIGVTKQPRASSWDSSQAVGPQ